MASEKITNIIEEVKTLTVLELSELVHELEETFGVSAAAGVAVVAAPAEEGGAAAAAAQTECDVILTDAGQAKMGVIKLVKEICGLGLKESKELVDNAPKPLKEKISEAEANELAEKFKAAGATVEIK